MRLLTVREVAEQLGISRRTLYKLRAERRIACVQVGARVLFRPEHVDDFLLQNEQRATTVPLRRRMS